MTAPLPFTLRAYGVAGTLLRPLVPLLVIVRAMRGKEDRGRRSERRGHAAWQRPDRPVLWLHGASVGEAVTILPLAERLGERGFAVVITTGTTTSAAVVASRLPRGAVHQYVPFDMPALVRRFLDHWHPRLAIFAESELWPTMIVEAHRREIPLVLVNARMSVRSFERWKRFPRTISALLGRFDLCLCQSTADAARFAALDARRVTSTGNLKFDAPPLPADPVALASLRAATKNRPTWIAASTHPGEEAVIAAAHRVLKMRIPDILTIIVPRHPNRGGDIAGDAAMDGLNIVQRSRGFLPDLGTDIYIADTLGEVGLFYRLSRLVLVGGTFARRGGQNPIEPAKLACAILHGPHVDNFLEAYGALDSSGAARRVESAESLASEVGALLSDPVEIDRMALAGAEAVASLAGALDRTMSAIDPYLMQLSLEHP